MRRTTLALSAAMTGALLLTGCGSSSSGSTAPTPTPSATAVSTPAAVPAWTAQSQPKVSGVYGDKPTITFTAVKAPTDLRRTVLSEGKGPVVNKGELLAVDYLGQVYGGKVFDNSYDRKSAAGFTIGTGQVIPGWDVALVGMRAGSRVLLNVPPASGYGTTGNAQAGIKGTDTIVFVVDIVASYGAGVAGDPAATPADQPPAGVTVGGDLGKEPTVAVAATATKPTASVATVLAKGSGAPLAAGLAVVQYTAVDWTSKSAGSTWKTGAPAGVTIAAGGTGAFDVLAGIPVGSRVLLETPGSSGGPYAVVIDVVEQVPTAKQSVG